MKIILIPVLVLLCGACSFEKYYLSRHQKVMTPYEQINFIELMKKYIDKDKPNPGNIEGIYSVSSLILKKSKGLFSSVEKEKTIDQKDHYAQVAIIRDHARNNREYIEIPIDKNYMPSYSIRGEFTALSEGNILVLKHFEPRGKVLSYAFTYDHEKDILEGIRTETNGNVTYTYKLTFVKLYPKMATAQK